MHSVGKRLVTVMKAGTGRSNATCEVVDDPGPGREAVFFNRLLVSFLYSDLSRLVLATHEI